MKGAALVEKTAKKKKDNKKEVAVVAPTPNNNKKQVPVVAPTPKRVGTLKRTPTMQVSPIFYLPWAPVIRDLRLSALTSGLCLWVT